MSSTPPIFAIAQFCMTLSWVVYAVLLPDLAQRVGLPKSAVVWLLMADQVLFMFSDFVAGVASDRMASAVARFGRLLGVLTAISAIALLVLPALAAGTASPMGLILPAAVWVVCSASMRAPLFALVGKQARSTTGDEFRWLLLGSGIAAGLAPYLATLLKGQSPMLPFALVAASLVFCAVLSSRAVIAGEGGRPAVAAETVAGLPSIAVFFVALACAALAFQINSAFNLGRLFSREVPADQLQWWTPAFWIGFNLALLLPPVLRAWLPTRRLGLFALIGAVALSLCPLVGSAAALAALQALAGAGWALFSSTAASTANAFGAPRRQGLYLGGVQAVMAGGSVLRLAMASAALPMVLGDMMFGLPVALWAFAAVLFFTARQAGRSAALGA